MASETATVDSGSGASGDYASLNAWEAGEQQNLITAEYIHTCTCITTGDNAADTTAFTIDGWTVSSDYYIVIQGGTGHTALKTSFDTSRYRFGVTDGNGIGNFMRYVRVQNLQLYQTYSANHTASIIYFAAQAGGSDIRITGCRFKGSGNEQSACISILDSDINECLIANNIIYGERAGIWITDGCAKIYNNTIYDCQNSGGIVLGADSDTIVIKNNAIWNTGDDVDDGGASSITVDYNAADDDLNTEFTETTNIQPTMGNNFPNAGTGDFTLTSGQGCENAGVGPDVDATVPATDIDGTARIGASCDIGADEYISGGEQYYKSVAGVFAPTGILAKNTKTARAGNFTLTGIITKKGFVPQAGAVTFSGAAVRLPKKGLAGAFTFAGSLTRTISVSLAGILTATGALGASLVGAIQQAVGGVLAFSGAITNKAAKALGGTFTLSGSIVKKTMASLAGVFVATGSIGRAVKKTLAGALALAGTIQKKITRALAGVVTFIGEGRGPGGNLFYQAVGGVLTFVGALGRFREVFRIFGTLTRALAIRTGGISKAIRVRGSITQSITLRGRLRR